MDVTWLKALRGGTEGLGKSTRGIRKFTKSSSQKERKDWFEPALNIHNPSFPDPHVTFSMSLFHPYAKKKKKL
jgi:hypothetical protein